MVVIFVLSWSAHVVFCSSEDVDHHRKQDADSGVGSDNGDKRLSATEVCVFICSAVIKLLLLCHAMLCWDKWNDFAIVTV